MGRNPPQPARAASAPSSRLRAAAGAFVAALALASCSPASLSETTAPRRELPPGTVLLMNDTPITADEVDVVAGWFARFEPQNSLAQCRRLALTNTIFPLVAAREIDPARRAAAEQQAREYERAIRAGELAPGPIAGPMEFEREGPAKSIGLDAWAAVIDGPIGQWSSVHETPGAFEIVRLKERGDEPSALSVRLKVGVLQFPYVDEAGGNQRMHAALDASKLVIVDPTWKDYVPLAWQHRLHVDSP